MIKMVKMTQFLKIKNTEILLVLNPSAYSLSLYIIMALQLDRNIVQLSQAKILAINSSRKRPSNPELWEDNVAKIRRNTGLAYQSRNGNHVVALQPPNLV
jgi:hypothetical protein